MGASLPGLGHLWESLLIAAHRFSSLNEEIASVSFCGCRFLRA